MTKITPVLHLARGEGGDGNDGQQIGKPLSIPPFWQLAALVSNGKVCQPEVTTWRLPGQPLPVFSGGNCGHWCIAAGLVGTRDMFKEEFPPPITEAGGELQECLREA